MLNCRNRTEIRIHTGFLLFLAVSLLFLPLRFLFAWLFAISFHELSHYIALKLYGIHINSIFITATGIKMHTTPTNLRQELICALAGPVGGLLPVVLVRYMPLSAVFAFVQSTVNLIPIGERDGGRILRCILQAIFGVSKGKRYYQTAERYIGVLILIAICFVAYLYHFYAPIALLILFLFFRGKFPCKPDKQIVQ